MPTWAKVALMSLQQTHTHTRIQVNTNGFTHGSAAAQLHLDVADTGSRLDDVERKKLRGMRRQTAWCTAA